jgi:hypothetical protein
MHTGKMDKKLKGKESIIEEATDFINQFYASVKRLEKMK